MLLGHGCVQPECQVPKLGWVRRVKQTDGWTDRQTDRQPPEPAGETRGASEVAEAGVSLSRAGAGRCGGGSRDRSQRPPEGSSEEQQMESWAQLELSLQMQVSAGIWVKK